MVPLCWAYAGWRCEIIERPQRAASDTGPGQPMVSNALAAVVVMVVSISGVISGQSSLGCEPGAVE